MTDTKEDPHAELMQQDCTRSHPHELMTPMCELRTEIARLNHANANLRAQLEAVGAGGVGAMVPPKSAHVGDSNFESWFSEYSPAGRGTKQQMRDSYAAGMGDPAAQPAPAQAAEPDFFTVCAWHEGGGEAGWIAIPGYSSETEHGVKSLVLEEARKEGYKGSITGRLMELEWEIRPVFLAAPAQPEPLDAVVKMLEKKAADYAEEFGHEDMGSLSFGSGSHADAKMEHYTGLLKLVDEIRSMPAQPDTHAQELTAYEITVGNLRAEIAALRCALAGTTPTPSKEYAELPHPDTHCFDDDTGKDVWSYNAELLMKYTDATHALRTGGKHA